MTKLENIVIANIHKRYTGVSATVKALVPHHREKHKITLLDTGSLGLGGELSFWQILWQGFKKPETGYRVWHARRDVEMLAGLFLRDILRQRWKLIFTSAAPKRHGWFLNWLIGKMDFVIATSKRSAQYLDRFDAIIPHGVDPDVFYPAKNRQDAMREAGFPDKYAIGIFGRIRPSKGTDLFVNAMIELLPEFPNYIAVITGLAQGKDAEFKAELDIKIKAAKLEKRIIFLGDLEPDAFRKWYQRIVICVAASRKEGFGLTPLEALSSGAAIVTSDAGYWPELVTPEIGALFKTNDQDALIDALRALMHSPDKTAQMGVYGRGLILEKHSQKNEANGIEKIYEKLSQK